MENENLEIGELNVWACQVNRPELYVLTRIPVGLARLRSMATPGCGVSNSCLLKARIAWELGTLGLLGRGLREALGGLSSRMFQRQGPVKLGQECMLYQPEARSCSFPSGSLVCDLAFLRLYSMVDSI